MTSNATTITVDPDWWKTIFDDVYLLTDARSVCDEEITRREVDLICALLPIRPEHEILDLCGGHGRHSLELCARGFARCTLLDYSGYLIEHATARAAEVGYPINFIRADARNAALAAESFHHVLIMGNSLGYMRDSAADAEILAEANRLLRPGGWLLIDVTDGAAVKGTFNPTAWHEVEEGIVVCRHREMAGNLLHVREMVLSKDKGLIRDCCYAIRLYEPQIIAGLLEKAGFSQVHVHSDFSPHGSSGDYGFMNCRMVGVGQKR
jgi:D-alanine-D-alanine ligase